MDTLSSPPPPASFLRTVLIEGLPLHALDDKKLKQNLRSLLSQSFGPVSSFSSLPPAASTLLPTIKPVASWGAFSVSRVCGGNDGEGGNEGERRGKMLVTFDSVESARQAEEVGEIQFCGSRLFLSSRGPDDEILLAGGVLPKERLQQKAAPSALQPLPPDAFEMSHRVIVENLSASWRDSHLHSLFKGFGEIVLAKVVIHREGGGNCTSSAPPAFGASSSSSSSSISAGAGLAGEGEGVEKGVQGPVQRACGLVVFRYEASAAEAAEEMNGKKIPDWPHALRVFRSRQQELTLSSPPVTESPMASLLTKHLHLPMSNLRALVGGGGGQGGRPRSASASSASPNLSLPPLPAAGSHPEGEREKRGICATATSSNQLKERRGRKEKGRDGAGSTYTPLRAPLSSVYDQMKRAPTRTPTAEAPDASAASPDSHPPTPLLNCSASRPSSASSSFVEQKGRRGLREDSGAPDSFKRLDQQAGDGGEKQNSREECSLVGAGDDAECPICMEEVSNVEGLFWVKGQECRHQLCNVCFRSLKARGLHRCPLCRRSFFAPGALWYFGQLCRILFEWLLISASPILFPLFFSSVVGGLLGLALVLYCTSVGLLWASSFFIFVRSVFRFGVNALHIICLPAICVALYCLVVVRLVTSTLLFVLESLVSGVVGETGERGHEPRGETTESAALAAKDNTRREEGVSRPTSGERDRSGASDQGRSEQHRDH
uniref:RING-type domain-containing protein n=1 Tax=Chromera velia CCMP2878 TaxID=1169474 RepID=A0A0G4GC29_9ALVE|eukprot:Cvel_21129.t1-p1 / transcript=Cvel_21129.t1 / gene=Cvel_21129 / organism=Chromera_velia_CCMP2878 / gene_product=hypothetical protein / transcript_product=hypothetical protein / location=Cvel_scaffold1957:7527-17189(+) / protein_length=717 / sequence_SO=supercontig / SO=protein_coding / is_pseudo=false